MRSLDYLYYRIYAQLTRRSSFFQHFNARILAVYLCSLCAGGWLLFLESAYLRLIKHSWFSCKQAAMLYAGSVYALSAMVFYHVFIVKGRDEKIVSRYEARWASHTDRKRTLALAFLMLVFPYALMVGMSIAFPRGAA